jgi:hypothetical protein
MIPHKHSKAMKMVQGEVNSMDTLISVLKMVPKAMMMMLKALKMEQVLQEDTLKMQLVNRFSEKK